jgi:hypothetical protein
LAMWWTYGGPCLKIKRGHKVCFTIIVGPCFVFAYFFALCKMP